MAKKRDRVQPLKPVELSEDEKELRILGMQYSRVIRDVEIIERVLPTLQEHIVALGLKIQNLQQQAEAKRLEKELEKKGANKGKP